MIADNQALTLNALRVTDESLDRQVQTAALYGQAALDQLDMRISELAGPAQEAAVFVRIAVAIQMRTDDLGDLASKHVTEFTRAVREACWFYPVPNGLFNDDCSHVPALFEHGAAFTPLRLLAIELAGLRDVQSMLPQIKELVTEPASESVATLALTRLGAATAAMHSLAADCVTSGIDERCYAAMALIACDPRIADDGLLELALNLDPIIADQAWAIATSRDPRSAVDHAAARRDMPPAQRARIMAMAGYPDSIINACAEIAETEGEVTVSQADLLELTLGSIPVEARCVPNSKAEKSRALRTLVLRVFREAHIGLRNDADIDGWQVDSILAHPTQAKQVRLRDGRVLSLKVPPLGRAIQEVSHPLRQWLYIERATTAQRVFSLSAFDVARRQDTSMTAAEFVDAMVDR
ncbi:hypothetical protein [Massilia scottii]|uniref:hypothetical protein n=1 Tax=Massilia scottii TaxID=3057166 RepID=UPI002796CCFD|nr:hypothetical protein [Massilia sp. CCM 9029]MDQ1835218.1 hypothetical protein [Massilia sp. CCM 9029]